MGVIPLSNVRLLAVFLALTCLVAVISVGWWAERHGYISIFGEACTDQGFDEPPSFDELVNDMGFSPYCARRIRDETWF